MSGKKVSLNSKNRITVLKATKNEELKIKSFCNMGICGKCVVKVTNGDISAPTKKELRKLGENRINAGYRLACQTTFKGNIVVEI